MASGGFLSSKKEYEMDMNSNLDMRLTQIVPSERQLHIQQMEFYGFVHFTINTFTGKEWGDGTEDSGIFNPDRLDAAQWVQAATDNP